MVKSHKMDSGLVEPNAVLLRDLEILIDQLLRRDSAETDNDLGLKQLGLHSQPSDAGLLLCGKRISVLRRAALDNIADVAVVPSQTDDGEHIIEELACRADERLSLQILLSAGTFTDEEHFGISRPDAKDDILPCF